MEEWPEITKATTLEEVRKIHRRIWQYMVDHGKKPDFSYVNHCVLCEYASVLLDSFGWHILPECKNICPAIWGLDEYGCTRYCDSPGALYGQWINETNLEKKRELAEQIRDIPFKEDN